MRQIGTCTFSGWDCLVMLGEYAGGRPALQLVDAADGEPVATASTNLPDVPLDPGEIVLKTYDENRGVDLALIRGGVVTPPHRHVRGLPVVRLSARP